MDLGDTINIVAVVVLYHTSEVVWNGCLEYKSSVWYFLNQHFIIYKICTFSGTL